MKSTAIICEYNPFHNGHLHHLNETKKLNKDNIIILVLSGNFLQRGQMCILDKWTKTKLALEYRIDLVIELPFIFASQSADIFAKGFIELCNHLKVDNIVFGSESNNVEDLKKLANIQLNDKDYDIKIKEYLDKGINYPTALSKALNDISTSCVSSPNDLLGLSYIREIIKQKSNIIPITIKRTNDYHDKEAKSKLSSATSIRKLLDDNKSIKEFVPLKTYNYLKNYKDYSNEYFKLLKYKIISEGTNIKNYQTVDEGIENRILKYINISNNIEELINYIKTKRYTYNKLSRMFTHILCNFTKEEATNNKDIKYIRILGFNDKGKKYLSTIKKELEIPLITNMNKDISKLLEIELRIDSIYYQITNSNSKLFQNKPYTK